MRFGSNRWWRPLVAALVAALATALVAGCSGPGPLATLEVGTSTPAASPAASLSPVPTQSPSPGPADDLDLLLRTLDAVHPDPWHGVSRADFAAALNAVKVRIATLTPEEAEVAVMRLVAMISAAGRDGHMFAVPVTGFDGPIMPLRIYEFAEGVFITADLTGNGLAGSRLLAVDGHPIADLLEELEPLVPRDGPATVPAFRPIFILRTDVLRGLGLLDSGPLRVTVGDPSGAGARDVVLAATTMEDFSAAAGPSGMVSLPARPDTLYLSDLDTVFSSRLLPESGTLYARYTAVQAPPGSAIADFAAAAGAPDVRRVVLDLRQNLGGDNRTYGALLDAIRDPSIDAAGRLYVLIDRLTFSAAANLATEIEQSTAATFVGEPMGGGLNFWDDVTWLALPHLPTPMQVGISTRYWQMSTPDDPRLTIEPQIGVPVSAADYFAGRDPALDAILSATPGS
jgi:hypothetical protein